MNFANIFVPLNPRNQDFSYVTRSGVCLQILWIWLLGVPHCDLW